ncbi:hypothetical protein BDB01DRAFT_794345 [Pilobolus umbonatus]|nr:hypothetical protein BDB01DRAFT_794345 [Pilobolus umbonatus]
MTHESKLRNEVDMEEENHFAVDHSSHNYGSIKPAHSTSASIYSNTPHSDDSSSDSSEEYVTSVNLVNRKKKRLQKHHKTAKPKLVSKLSNIVGSARQSEEEDNVDNVIEIPQNNLIIPELDPKADELREFVCGGSNSQSKKYSSRNVNLSNIRESYRHGRMQQRHEFSEQAGQCKGKTIADIKNKLKYDAYISEARRILFAKRSIVLFVYNDLLVDLLFCLAYLIEMKQGAPLDATPSWLFKWRSYDLWFFCVILSIWNMGSFIMRMFLTGRPLATMLSFRSFIECVTTYPFLISIFIENGEYLYVPYFLRSWVLLLRIKSVLKIKTNLLMTDKQVDPLKSKLIYLIGTLISLLYNGMSAFQYCEITFGKINYSILDSLYVVMVTLSTVGYGDITPTTEGSRIVMMLLIVISLAVLPSLLADALNTLRKRNDWGGYVSESFEPFILIVGSFRHDQITEILDGFLNMENTESDLNVVFLDINRPNEELKYLERNSMWGHRIQIIHGSVLDEHTLHRVRARHAKAIFTLSDQHAADPTQEDEKNTVRLWALYCYTVVCDVQIYTYNMSPSTSIYQKMAKEIICVREFKQYLLAMNCRCRGASTLLTNLLHQRRPMDHYDESWQAQYDDGSCNEIYMDKTPDALIGLSFTEAAWIVYSECQVILFGVKALLPFCEHRQILLNPDNNYILKPDDLCVYICESPKEINDVNSLTKIYVNDKLNKARSQPLAAPERHTSASSSSSLKNESISSKLASKLMNSDLAMTQHNYCTDQHRPSKTRSPSPISYKVNVQRSLSTETNKSKDSNQHIYLNKQIFHLTPLPLSGSVMLTGSRKLINRLGQATVFNQDEVGSESSPLCYLLDEPWRRIDDITIDSTDYLSGHILVCMHQRVSNIYKFIYYLRSSQLKKNELQDIVFLCTSRPSGKTFELVSRFPRIYFMLGDCKRPDDLIKAGVKRAKQVVVMSERECLDQHQRSSDSPAIMTSHLLDILLQDKPNDASRIVNLVEKSNIRFMHLLQGKDVAEEIDVFYTPAYAAGNVVVDSLLSNVLLSQTYYKSDIVSIIKALCGMPGPLFDKDTDHILKCATHLGERLDQQSRHLTLISLPQAFIDSSFSVLFKNLILGHGVLSLGLLRAPDDQMGNELSFVYTNPVPSLVLRKSDKVYVLASPGWSYH